MELRDIKGFPNYKVSSDGRVWSNNGRWGRCGWLKGSPNKAGYLKVNLCVEGKSHMKYVHRLVSEAFIPNPNNLPQINHKDEDKTNNSVTNLEWSTSEYNNNYGSHNAKVKATQQQRRGKPVVQLTLDGEEVARYCCLMEAARQTGFDIRNISDVCLGKKNTHKGYRWKHVRSDEE